MKKNWDKNEVKGALVKATVLLPVDDQREILDLIGQIRIKWDNYWNKQTQEYEPPFFNILDDVLGTFQEYLNLS